MRWVVVAGCLLLAACEGGPTPDQIAVLTIGEACSAYGHALASLTPLRRAGQLTPDQVAKVDHANQVADSVCTPEPPADMAAAIARINNATASLLLVKEAKP